MRNTPLISCVALAAFACIVPVKASRVQEKVSLEQLVTRHLASIGTPEARSAVKSRTASGKATLRVRLGGAGNLDGDGMMASMGEKLRFAMRFTANDYVGEDMAFDGNRATTGMQPQGKRSLLSEFLNSQSGLLKEGLIGGTISTAWPLLRIDKLQPKLEYKGLKKIDGQDLHEVAYRPKSRGGEIKISLYFEPQLFRHVRSKYMYEVGAGVATREASNANPEIYYSLTEDFGDFRTVDGLTIPGKYKLVYSGEGRSASSMQEFTFIIDSISHKEQINDRIFLIQ